MKTEFKAIAMRCNQEQFEAIKPKLDMLGLRIGDVYDFPEYKYLINNMHGHVNHITNWHNDGKTDENREVYEEWNEEFFLKYCGIEAKVTEEKQIDPTFIERYNITDKVKELLSECKKQGFSLDIDNGVIILKQI